MRCLFGCTFRVFECGLLLTLAARPSFALRIDISAAIFRQPPCTKPLVRASYLISLTTHACVHQLSQFCYSWPPAVILVACLHLPCCRLDKSSTWPLQHQAVGFRVCAYPKAANCTVSEVSYLNTETINSLILGWRSLAPKASTYLFHLIATTLERSHDSLTSGCF